MNSGTFIRASRTCQDVIGNLYQGAAQVDDEAIKLARAVHEEVVDAMGLIHGHFTQRERQIAEMTVKVNQEMDALEVLKPKVQDAAVKLDQGQEQ